MCDEARRISAKKLWIQLIGKNDFSVYNDIEQNGLSNNLERID